jgi:hypothetical protein
VSDFLAANPGFILRLRYKGKFKINVKGSGRGRPLYAVHRSGEDSRFPSASSGQALRCALAVVRLRSE